MQLHSNMQLAGETNLLERRSISILLNAVLFVATFLLLHIIWSSVLQEITGVARLALCGVGAGSLTWIMAFLTKGRIRLAFTLMFVVLLFITLIHQP